ncbi:5'-methylthioadenosine/S-adenosylhomocysteine nucleosidase [candidate division GN15 bacterium]|uniref:adenosylhomocysteine nucleosidase n=1 Tax=candidate division GN15 bacterium TaxID=2072418 RepID=A0A855X3R0_9BACT|nr:MAG: 5'-methylthioadenosine/S-adenosylhomocysteine nucleosidase [candidate division GN15 bacterium]
MRGTPPVCGIIAALIVLAAGLTSAAADSPYLLLYAFDAEGDAIAAHMTIGQTDTVLGRAVRSGIVSGRPAVLAESGIGMTNAAMTTQRLIDQFHPTAVIFTGIAGAIDSSVHIGDIVAASSWVQHDFGYIGADGFKREDIGVYDPRRDSVTPLSEFPVDSILLALAKDCSQGTLRLDSVGSRRPKVIVGGVGASGNTFIDSREKRDWLAHQLDARVVDMESAAVAQVCLANNVNVIILRSTSDLAGGSGSSTAEAELSQFFRIAAGNSAAVVSEILRRMPDSSASGN